MTSPQRWFILGHEPLLSLAELFAVFGEVPFGLTKDIARLKGQGDPQELIERLGGTVKIAEEIGYGLDEAALLDLLAKELESVSGKIHFGLSLHAVPRGAEQAEQWGLALKKRLKTAGLSVRYVDNRGKAMLSSVSVEKNGLVDRGREFIIIPDQKDHFKVAKTLAVQPFESFSERDFGRPGRDDLSGMLPPKLAIMMINCADADKNEPLYDPSCGSGTIVSEAALLGFSNIIGSDLSEKAVVDTERNITWLKERHPEQSEDASSYTIFQHDIRLIPDEITPGTVGAIVSEPYMGPPLKGRELPSQLEQTATALADLYRATFETFAKLLKPDGTVIYSFPRFGKVRTVALVQQHLQELGFTSIPLLPKTLSADPYVLYQREGQRVGREIWKFQLK